jgi:hypothetical protein
MHVEVNPPHHIFNMCGIILISLVKTPLISIIQAAIILIVLIPSAIDGSLIDQLHGCQIAQHGSNLHICHRCAF